MLPLILTVLDRDLGIPVHTTKLSGPGFRV